MTTSVRSLLVGLTLGVAVTLGMFQLLTLRHGEHLPPSAPPTSQIPEHAGHAVPAAGTKEVASTAIALTANQMIVSPERLQSIGVKFALAERRPVERTIRTVGRVELDERRLAHVHIKVEGWIDTLLVNATGERVTKDQVLFTIYSPDLVATQQEYLLAAKGQRMLGGSEFPEVAEGARSLLAVTRQRLQLWDVPEHQIRDLERTGKVLTTLHVHSPITGTVMNKVALAGMRVGPGDDLYTIADLSHIWILADIYEYEVPLITVGQTALVTLSYDPGTVLRGKASFISPMLDPQTRTAKVRFELPNPGERLKPGMYANVELKIPLGIRLVVPRDAILESGERQVLFLHHGGGRLEWRNVTLGNRSGEWVEVIEGLREGEHVVTSANFLLDSESRLKAAVGGMQGMQH
jgi:membrane fusion protein, copper/silver efflux system